jgi:hypothetical protein
MILSSITTLWFAGTIIFNLIIKTKDWFMNWRAINFDFYSFNINLEWFYVNTNVITFITIISLIMMIVLILIGRKISEGKIKIKMDIIYFLVIYPVIAPTWLAKSIYNVLIAKKTVWR